MVQDNTAAYRRMLVEGVIDRSLRAIQDDPRRGLRKLVDMGADCATGTAAEALSAHGAGHAGK